MAARHRDSVHPEWINADPDLHPVPGYGFTVDLMTTAIWVPSACMLPTVQRPLRVAEFDELLALALRRLDRPEPTRLRLLFDGAQAVEATARDLAAREIECCSFFAFEFTRTADGLWLDVTVPPAQVGVLDALATRVSS